MANFPIQGTFKFTGQLSIYVVSFNLISGTGFENTYVPKIKLSNLYIFNIS